MASTMKFELVSPERVLLSGEAEQVQLPGTEGDMTVLPGHAPLISTLRPGVLDVLSGGTRTRVFVKSGFADVDPSRLTVLAEKAIDVAEMNADRLAAEIKIAETELAEAEDDEARSLAERSIEQLKALGSRAG